mgnify:CR=1 FL=1
MINQPITHQDYTKGLDRDADILYCEVSTDELKQLIIDTAATRKMASAGKDLHQMRKEYNRRTRRQEGKKRISYKKYEEQDEPEDFAKMLEDTDKAPNNFLRRSAVVGGMTAKQEKFAMECVATGDLLHAYKAAGYSQGKDNKNTMQRAKNLFYNNKKVRRRIENLKEEALRRMSWNAEKVLDKVANVYDQAMDNDDYTNANRSMETIARHLGMFVDKSEQRVKLSHFSDEDSEDKIEKDIQSLADAVGLQVVNGGKK